MDHVALQEEDVGGKCARARRCTEAYESNAKMAHRKALGKKISLNAKPYYIMFQSQDLFGGKLELGRRGGGGGGALCNLQ